MSAALLIARRELLGYLTSMTGWLILALVLLADGLLFNVFALGGVEKKSFDVLQGFFYLSSGTTMISSVVISMRLFAEERQQGTMVLLETARSPSTSSSSANGSAPGPSSCSRWCCRSTCRCSSS